MSKTFLIFALTAGLAVMAAAPQVVYDAPGVTVDLGSAGVMHRTGVAYPAAALKQGVQGTVVVELKLDANGNVADARVVSGPDELRNAALQSVLQWHFMKNLAGSSRQVSISFRVPEAAAQTPAMAAPQPPWVGHTVKAINVFGLSDESRAALLSQLPVHEGVTLSVDSLQAVTRAAKEFDEHLSVGVMSTGTNDVTLEITPPGAVRTGASLDTKRIIVGSGPQASKLLSQPRPVYPPEAKAAHTQGVVKLRAIIAKDGTIQNLELISGEPVLAQAAIDAVKQWVYQPTLLNGQPVEVVTQIDVNFTLAQ